jgi:hypothetical protein
LSLYERAIRRLERFRIVSPAPLSVEDWLELGFDTSPTEGDAVIPTPVGPVSTFNASGREIVRRDLPKVSQSRMVWSSWKDWHGNPHSGLQIRSQDVYQRDLVPPPEEYISVLRSGTELVISSRPMDVAVDEEGAIVHVINLFLELFGEVSITSADPKSSASLAVKRLNWRVLPPGEYPFARAKEELKEFFRHLQEGVREVVESRIRSVTQYNPDFIAVGVGGFREYVVFGFRTRGVYVLESPTLGNATYVFKNDWSQLSSLSKKQILDGSLHEARLIHNHRWTGALRQAIVGK